MAPAGPTNGCPSKSSLSPGASPMSMSLEGAAPSPGTPWVADFHSAHRLHSFTASRSSLMDFSERAPVSAFSSSTDRVRRPCCSVSSDFMLEWLMSNTPGGSEGVWKLRPASYVRVRSEQHCISSSRAHESRDLLRMIDVTYVAVMYSRSFVCARAMKL